MARETKILLLTTFSLRVCLRPVRNTLPNFWGKSSQALNWSSLLVYFAELFSSTAPPMIQSFLDGYNVTVRPGFPYLSQPRHASNNNITFLWWADPCLWSNWKWKNIYDGQWEWHIGRKQGIRRCLHMVRKMHVSLLNVFKYLGDILGARSSLSGGNFCPDCLWYSAGAPVHWRVIRSRLQSYDCRSRRKR